MAKGKIEPVRRLSEAQKQSPFAKSKANRRKRGINWADVDGDMLRYAAAAVTTANATLVVSSAMGGIGACVRVWAGDDKWVEYAADAEELSDWLEAIGDHYQSGSEDLRMILGMGSGNPDEDEQTAD